MCLLIKLHCEKQEALFLIEENSNMIGVLVRSFAKQINTSVREQTSYAIPSAILVNRVQKNK